MYKNLACYTCGKIGVDILCKCKASGYCSEKCVNASDHKEECKRNMDGCDDKLWVGEAAQKIIEIVQKPSSMKIISNMISDDVIEMQFIGRLKSPVIIHFTNDINNLDELSRNDSSRLFENFIVVDHSDLNPGINSLSRFYHETFKLNDKTTWTTIYGRYGTSMITNGKDYKFDMSQNNDDMKHYRTLKEYNSSDIRIDIIVITPTKLTTTITFARMKH